MISKRVVQKILILNGILVFIVTPVTYSCEGPCVDWYSDACGGFSVGPDDCTGSPGPDCEGLSCPQRCASGENHRYCAFLLIGRCTDREGHCNPINTYKCRPVAGGGCICVYNGQNGYCWLHTC
jgi:hypothetical protein